MTIKIWKTNILSAFFGHHSVLFVTGSIHVTPFSKCVPRPVTLYEMQHVTDTIPPVGWSVA